MESPFPSVGEFLCHVGIEFGFVQIEIGDRFGEDLKAGRGSG